MKTQIIKGINENKDLLDLRKLLIELKKEGGTQEEAIQILEEIRIEFRDDENKDDRVLELLDFACSWCQKRFKIWN
ncbi:MAG: hypothetical protein AB8H03_06825 [Saprospiraceae bacterium]